jgi:hypothetical protein
MRNLLSITAAVVASMIVAGPTLAKKAEVTVTYLGNSDNIAEEGQGGNGTSEETTTGPKGRVLNENNPDTNCNNCDTEQTDSPGNSNN